jgi:hypothetical protein
MRIHQGGTTFDPVFKASVNQFCNRPKTYECHISLIHETTTESQHQSKIDFVSREAIETKCLKEAKKEFKNFCQTFKWKKYFN